MMAAMADNQQVIIASLPTGALAATDFEVRGAPMPEPGDGQVLCRTIALTIGAGQRAGLQGSASYAGAPEAGRLMGGNGIAEVVESTVGRVPVGSIVAAPTGWQQWSVHKGPAVEMLEPDVDPSTALGALGTNGLTAYFGLLSVGQPQPGETVLVSAAAGSVGHLVGQIARLQGCRVVGVTGSDAKGELLTGELGFDAFVNHRADTFRDDFKAATADGIDVYFDNTGGDILGAALRRMKPHGRIVCCGVVSQYDTSDPAPGPRGIPGLLVNNRVRMEGFLVFDFARRYDEARSRMRAWLDAGEIRSLHDEVTGLEQAPQAFVDLLAGGNVGTRIVRVAD